MTLSSICLISLASRLFFFFNFFSLWYMNFRAIFKCMFNFFKFQLDQRTDAVVVLNMIQSALAETKWVSHMQLILAKVPILRIHFCEPFTDITVDLNANNSVAIRNTHLLCYYSSCKIFSVCSFFSHKISK